MRTNLNFEQYIEQIPRILDCVISKVKKRKPCHVDPCSLHIWAGSLNISLNLKNFLEQYLVKIFFYDFTEKI